MLNGRRIRIPRHEPVEIIVSVKNDRNLAALTVYGDIEGQENVPSVGSSNEIYITAGVVCSINLNLDGYCNFFSFTLDFLVMEK